MFLFRENNFRRLGLLILLPAVLDSAAASTGEQDRDVLLSADNPEPTTLPTLGVWQEYSRNNDRHYRYLSARFQNVPDFTTDMWCYESSGITFESARQLSGGRVEMRHHWESRPWGIVTTASPRADGLELVARLKSLDGGDASEPTEYPSLNVCWQLRRAPGFASQPEPYPEFVKRCFILTQRGLTFLHATERRPIPVQSPQHKTNNPPWVQMYLPESAPDDISAQPNSWADYSTDRYTLPIIGAVSRDRKYLAALGTGSEMTLSQAWHDCMHNNARWLPAAAGPGKEWRVRLYVMPNDPAALIQRFKHDFSAVAPWK